MNVEGIMLSEINQMQGENYYTIYVTLYSPIGGIQNRWNIEKENRMIVRKATGVRVKGKCR